MKANGKTAQPKALGGIFIQVETTILGGSSHIEMTPLFPTVLGNFMKCKNMETILAYKDSGRITLC